MVMMMMDNKGKTTLIYKLHILYILISKFLFRQKSNGKEKTHVKNNSMYLN